MYFSIFLILMTVINKIIDVDQIHGPIHRGRPHLLYINLVLKSQFTKLKSFHPFLKTTSQ